MTFADRFSVSDLDYDTWANKMVAEGKMYWPANSTSHVIQARDATYTIKNVACGFLGANKADYQEGETKFCNLVGQYVGGILLGAELLLKDGLCDDHQGCLLVMDIAMGQAGAYVASGIPSVCVPMFEAVYNDCGPDAGGGSGQLTITDNKGTQKGTIQGQFMENDNGATCPANTNTFKCKAGLF